MQEFLSQIEWVPTLVSFVLAFGLGMAWYSPLMFVKKWMAGKGTGVVTHPMWMPMMAQAGSTLLLAIIVNIFMVYDNYVMSGLTGIIIAGFIKANGLFNGKSMWAIAIEAWYIIVATALMVVVNILL